MDPLATCFFFVFDHELQRESKKSALHEGIAQLFFLYRASERKKTKECLFSLCLC